MELVKGYQYELTGSPKAFTDKYGKLTYLGTDDYSRTFNFVLEKDYYPNPSAIQIGFATRYGVNPCKLVRISEYNLHYAKLYKSYEPYDPNQENEDDCL